MLWFSLVIGQNVNHQLATSSENLAIYLAQSMSLYHKRGALWPIPYEMRFPFPCLLRTWIRVRSFAFLFWRQLTIQTNRLPVTDKSWDAQQHMLQFDWSWQNFWQLWIRNNLFIKSFFLKNFVQEKPFFAELLAIKRTQWDVLGNINN